MHVFEEIYVPHIMEINWCVVRQNLFSYHLLASLQYACVLDRGKQRDLRLLSTAHHSGAGPSEFSHHAARRLDYAARTRDIPPLLPECALPESKCTLTTTEINKSVIFNPQLLLRSERVV